MASKEVLTSLESLHRELEKLEPAIKHIETAQQVTQIIKGIPQKHIELLKEIKDNDAKHKGELKNLFSLELARVTQENKNLAKFTADIQSQVKAEQDALAKVRETVHEFHDRVEKIKFPERLDKLEANIAGIMAAIQAVQSRLDTSERNILDRLKDLSISLKESKADVKIAIGLIKETIKKQHSNSKISWALIILAAIAVTFSNLIIERFFL